MPRHLISDAHEWINEIPTVPIYSTMASRAQVKILQANLQRKRIASTELLDKALRENATALLIQEPYTYLNKVANFGRYDNKVITGNKVDEQPWAAIVLLDPAYTATLLTQLSCSHCVCAHITGPVKDFYLVSQYYQYSHDVQVHLVKTERILRSIKSKRILIGGDFNGVSPLWSDKVTAPDEVGAKIEDLIAQHNLIALNEAGQPSTFEKGRRDIDITFVRPEFLKTIATWTVQED